MTVTGHAIQGKTDIAFYSFLEELSAFWQLVNLRKVRMKLSEMNRVSSKIESSSQGVQVKVKWFEEWNNL